MLSFLILFATLIYCVRKYFTWNFDYFKKQGIKGPEPEFFFGNWNGVWNEEHHLTFFDNQLKYGKIYGMFNGRTPNLVVSDLELARKILVKDFDCFTNRPGILFNNKYIMQNVGSLKDQDWKDVRGVMSTALTSTKLKMLMDEMSACGDRMVNDLKARIKDSKSININARDITSGFALDVITSCGMGMHLNTTRDTSDPFIQKAMKLMQGDPSSKLQSILRVLFYIYPNLMRLLPASTFADFDFFVEASRNILNAKYAQMAAGQSGKDIVDTIIQSSTSESSPFHKNEDRVFAQILMLVLAGFETSAVSMAHTLHCLAVDSKAQDKLREEIRIKLKKHGSINFEMLQDCPYLDQCISESLRVYPIATHIVRECGKSVEYDGIKIKKGMLVSIPLYAIHRDPEIYPNPEIFDPERFSTEERGKRDNLSYMTFGYGPRGCLGMRLANEELRLGIIHVIHNFKLSKAPETMDPPKFLPGLFTFNGIVAPKLPFNVEII